MRYSKDNLGYIFHVHMTPSQYFIPLNRRHSIALLYFLLCFGEYGEKNRKSVVTLLKQFIDSSEADAF